jgi:hypothetical protein
MTGSLRKSISNLGQESDHPLTPTAKSLKRHKHNARPNRQEEDHWDTDIEKLRKIYGQSNLQLTGQHIICRGNQGRQTVSIMRNSN